MSRLSYWDKASRDRNKSLPRGSASQDDFAWRDYLRAICELSEEIDRLEDLRRWRPLAEIPSGKSGLGLIVQRADVAVDVAFQGSYIRGQGWLIEGKWVEPADEARWRWTYIPGQEPAQ
jgi:hypothetical protein